jgi:hypothetical protein
LFSNNRFFSADREPIRQAERLRLSPGYTENPNDESTAKAWDAQFELFLRAMLAQASVAIEIGS